MTLTLAVPVALGGLGALAGGGAAYAATTTPGVSYYVAQAGSDTVTGGGANTCVAQSAPCATLTQALSQIPAGSTVAATIYVTGTIADPGTATISTPVTIIGVDTTTSGPAVIDDTATAGSSVVDVDAAVTANLDNLTIAGDNTDFGGGIDIASSGATLNVTDSTITDNTSGPNGGGGIFNQGGTVNVTDSTIAGNSASGRGGGGGIFNDSGTVNVTDSTIADNSVGNAGGGGILNLGGTVDVTDSTIAGNNTASGGGGGIYNGGTVNVTDSTIAGNSAYGLGGAGGGIFNNAEGTVDVTDSTIAGNAADGGGGIDNYGAVNVTDSTIADNTASGGGGGIYNYGIFDYGSSVFAGTDNTCFFGTHGTVTDSGGNVTDSTSSSCASGSDVTSLVDSDLGSLAYNGGPTQTMALLDTVSPDPAIGAVATGCPATDQRGLARPSTDCDAGAYQTGAYNPAVTVLPASQVIAPGASAAVTATLDIGTSPAPVGFPVDFAVTSGPDSGQSGTVLTTATGTATFSFANGGTPGTDVVSVTSPVAPGTTAPGVVTAGTVDVVVGVAPAFTSPSTAYFPWLGADTTFPVQVTGTPTPTVTLTGTLPQGLSFDSTTDTISGTAGLFALGSHEVTVTATNGIGSPATETLDIVVGFAPVMLAPSRATFHVGHPGHLAVFSFAYPTAAITETGTLPAGVSFTDNGNGSASLAGTPAVGSAGSYPITVTATNPFGTSTQSVTLYVHGAPNNPGSQ